MSTPASEIGRSSALYVLVADAKPEQIDYRELADAARVQWGFAAKPEIFGAALRMQPWDLIVVDQSMLDAIPDELLAALDVESQNQDMTLLLDHDHLEEATRQGLLDTCGYLLRGPTLVRALRRLLRRHLHTHSLNQERVHLEQEIARILEDWEQSIRARTRNLEQANQHLKAIDEMKSHFLANVSHDLRTPLTVIRSYVDLLLACPPENQTERDEFLNIVAAETMRLSRMIDDLLELARIDTGHIDWEIDELDLREVVDSVFESMAPLLRRGKLTYDADGIPEHLPLVQADSARLAQVLGNLVDNSLASASPEGGTLHVRAELSSERRDGELLDLVCVRVEDTGESIPRDELPRLFDRFSQGGSRHGSRGASLGLAICKEIIEHHGGRIWADPSYTEGARFCFTLPVSGRIELPGER